MPASVVTASEREWIFAIVRLLSQLCGTASSGKEGLSHRGARGAALEMCRQHRHQDRGSSRLTGGSATDSVMLNVDAWPSWLSTQMRPPCSSTNFVASVSPSPVPAARRRHGRPGGTPRRWQPGPRDHLQISLVAVGCSSASPNACLSLSTSVFRSAFSCWHWAHCIPSVSQVRVVGACQGLRGTVSGPPPEFGVPAVLWGTGAPTLPRPDLGRQMGGSGAWLALEPVGRPHRRLRRVRTHVYAMLLAATRRPGAWVPPRLNRQWKRLTGMPSHRPETACPDRSSPGSAGCGAGRASAQVTGEADQTWT